MTQLILDQPLDLAAAREAVLDDARGACVLFEGVVRDHDGGRGVTRLEYSAHPDAGTVMAEVLAEVEADFGVRAVATHRVGRLEVGDVALVAACASGHRAEAFAACGALVDRIKQRVPVWKFQVFTDGSDEWVGLGEH
ncbi:molybdenum cofactor biosynthesis protein MoaE [Luteococcus peritonei]|uniref:Molybdenum cofactor biosynthesis protein MoaE n=1 Tax=Luteococcus peritonei TaxID=88874 RepID=A0ABW4RRN3_9ACTN